MNGVRGDVFCISVWLQEGEINSILQLVRYVKAKQGFEDKDYKPWQIGRARGDAR